MITQEKIVSDLELRLSKSKPSSDLDITYEQMAYWVDQARDSITKEYVDNSKTIDESLVFKVDGAAPYSVGESVFVDLSVVPLDIKKNHGVVYVRNAEGEYLYNSTSGNNRFLSKLSFTKSSACTVVYTIEGSSLVLEGGNGPLSTTYDVGVVHSELSRTKAPSDKYYVAPSTLISILELAEQIGLRELYGSAYYDITQDGKGNDIR